MARPLLRKLLAVPLALLSGCTSFARMSAPPLDGSPETTGIVVVEPDITFYANTLGTRYGERLISGAIVRADETKRVVSGRATGGVVVFSNLAPGKWRLALVEGELQPGVQVSSEITRWRRHYETPPENADAFTFEVRAGEALYAGAGIVDDDRADSRGVRFSRHDDTVAEQRTWERLEELYGNTSWGPILHTKVGPLVGH